MTAVAIDWPGHGLGATIPGDMTGPGGAAVRGGEPVWRVTAYRHQRAATRWARRLRRPRGVACQVTPGAALSYRVAGRAAAGGLARWQRTGLLAATLAFTLVCLGGLAALVWAGVASQTVTSVLAAVAAV